MQLPVSGRTDTAGINTQNFILIFDEQLQSDSLVYSIYLHLMMKTGIVLVNGISLPHPVLDQAIEWATTQQSSLSGLFLYHQEEYAEGYGFPSDIEQAETLESELEAEKQLERLISDHAVYAAKLAGGKGVVLPTKILRNPSEADLQQELKLATLVWLDADTFQNSGSFASVPFDVDDIMRLAPAVTVNAFQKGLPGEGR